MPVTNSLKPWAFRYNMLLITLQVFTGTQSAYPMQPGDTLPTAKIPGKIMAAQPEPEQALHTPSTQRCSHMKRMPHELMLTCHPRLLLHVPRYQHFRASPLRNRNSE